MSLLPRFHALRAPRRLLESRGADGLGLLVLGALAALGLFAGYALAPELPRLEPQTWSVPNVALVDQHGRRASTDELHGHVWIANFMFTRCPTVCPLLTARMRQLQQALADPALRFASFSVDPRHDSVAALHAYAASWADGETRWRLFRMEPDALDELLDAMRLPDARDRDEAAPPLHTSLFFLMDANGEVCSKYDSNDATALRRLLADAETVQSTGARCRSLPRARPAETSLTSR